MRRYTIEEIAKKNKAQEKRRNITRIIIYIIIIPLVIYNAIILYQLMLNGNTTPSVFGYKTFVISSGSMEPSLKIGDIVIAKEISDQANLQKGDIISFREGDSIVTHRINDIIQEETNGENEEKTEVTKYRTKGDANNDEDTNSVELKNIEGEFVSKIPVLGWLVLFLQNKLILVVVIIFIYILYIHNSNVEKRILDRREKRNMYEKVNNEKDKIE